MITRLRKESNEWIRKLLKDKFFKVYLNLGCGSDEDCEENNYSDYFKWDKRIMVDKKILNSKFDNSITFEKFYAEELPILSDSVNFVFCHWSFYEFDNKLKAIKEIKRILKKDGKVLISYWSEDKIEVEAMQNHLKREFKILDFWELNCDVKLDLREGKAEIIYGELK